MCGSKDCPKNISGIVRFFTRQTSICAVEDFEASKAEWLAGRKTTNICIASDDCLDVKDEDLMFLRQVPVDNIHSLTVRCPKVTDVIGMVVADIVERSPSIYALKIVSEKITEATCAAVANALRINTSLAGLYICNSKHSLDRGTVLALMAGAVAYNPDRPRLGSWAFRADDYPHGGDFEVVKEMAHAGPSRSRADTLLRPTGRLTVKRVCTPRKLSRDNFIRAREDN